jgi:hypothetical protein
VGIVRRNPGVKDILNLVRRLTLQLFAELGNFLLVVIISMGGALQAEFLGSDFLQSLHHLVFKVLNLLFKSGDLGGKPISRNFKVMNCTGEYVSFNLSCDSGSLLLIQIHFQVDMGLCLRAGSTKNDTKG